MSTSDPNKLLQTSVERNDISECGEDAGQLTIDGESMLQIAYDDLTKAVLHAAKVERSIAWRLAAEEGDGPGGRVAKPASFSPL